MGVDPDAVFFPEHLRQKIRWNYRTPHGSAVYLKNTFYKFKFLGAIEALTREALQLYFERGWECEAHLGQQGGEDLAPAVLRRPRCRLPDRRIPAPRQVRC